MSILNNFETDVKMRCIEKGITQQDLGRDVGSTGQYVSRLIKNPSGIVNKTFTRIMERLGYDIRLTYEPKEEKSSLDLDNLLEED